MTSVPFLAPTFPPPAEVAEDYEAIVRNGIYSNGGPFERAFSRALEQWIGHGVSACVTSSGTAALELAIASTLGGRKGRVVIASFTFAAAPLVLTRLGFEPLFLDIEPDSWQPSLSQAREALNKHKDVAGIVLTPTFGVADPDIEAWEELAKSANLGLIIDAAAGFGSRYPWDEPAGARGDCEVFSFHATKMLAIGEGGAVVSRDPALVSTARSLRNFGFDGERRVRALGTNAKLPELPAAIGLRQLSRLPARLELRRQLQHDYVHAVEPYGVAVQPRAELSAIPFVSALMPTHGSRDKTLELLQASGIECRTYYDPPMHLQPFFRARPSAGPLDVTEDIWSRILSLPTADELDSSVIERVASCVAEAVNGT